ncbi:MAG: transporter [Acidobacteriota bacterium]|nr:transporter [Acidobacteriota bacterium]
MNKIAIRFLFLSLFTLISAFAVCAQNSAPPDDEPDFIVPARPTVSNPAEFQRPGVLQLEFGYNANFHATGNYKYQQDAPLALRFAASRRLLLELDTDNPYSQKDLSGARNTGAGDTQLGIQGVLQPENESRPGIAVAYYIKLPTASSAKGLGTGRVDHNFIALASKKIGQTTVDFNAIYLLAGRTSGKGFASSGQAALAASRNLTKRFGVQGEISGSSRNDLQSGAMFGLGVITYQINRRLVFDSGLRLGLTSGAPRAGVVAGVTVGVADLYKKYRH